MHREMDSQNNKGLLGDTFRYSAHCIIVTVTVPELLMVLHRDRGRITKQSSVCVTPVSYTHLTLPTIYSV